MAFGLDDLAGIVVGGIGGVVVTAITDYAAGEHMTAADAAGAFVSGAIIGEGAVNAPETGGASFAAAVGGGAGLAGNLVKQGISMVSGDQKGVNVKEAAVATAAGAALGGATEMLPEAKIPGLSGGRNSMKAVAQGVRTKIEKGTVKRMALSTAIKGAVGGQAAHAYRTVGEVTGEVVKDRACTSRAGQSLCQ